MLSHRLGTGNSYFYDILSKKLCHKATEGVIKVENKLVLLRWTFKQMSRCKKLKVTGEANRGHLESSAMPNVKNMREGVCFIFLLYNCNHSTIIEVPRC